MKDELTTDNTLEDHTVGGDSQVKPLPEDNDTPFSPPTDPVNDLSADIDVRTQQGKLDPTHPATDSTSDMASQEVYDAGVSAAADASEPNAGNTVVGYEEPHKLTHEKLDEFPED